MCDTLCVPFAQGMLFAKNSDRPPGEAQVVEWYDRRAPSSALRTQYLTLPDPGAAALVGSRPTWLWGLEHGVNEHGVAAGNEKLWTVDDPRSLPPALLGMDLVRLALERALTADDALDIVTTLLETHGQGGSGEADRDAPYFSSFLLADPTTAWIVETSDRTWAARRVSSGGAISNRISLTTDWDRASVRVAAGTSFDRWRNPKTPTGFADHRLAATTATVERASTVDARSLAATLRHHGTRPWGAPGSDPSNAEPVPAEPGDDGHGVTVCMHVRGVQATTASMIAELLPDRSPRVWVCLGNPCVGVYVPCFPPAIPAPLSADTQWRRFATLRQRVDADPAALLDIRARLAPVESELWDEADALAETDDVTAQRAFSERAYAPVDVALRALGV